MAHEENFFGDRLRLSSFLRVVKNIPQRPLCHRKSAPDARPDGGSVHTGSSSLNKGHSNHRSRSRSTESGLISGNTDLVTPKASNDASSLSHVYSSDPHAKAYLEELFLVADELNLQDEIAIGSEARDATRANITNLNLSRPQKTQVLYRSKVKKNSSSRYRVSTRKRRLTVNELAIVRTSTEDALPDPGIESERHSEPISDADPIEDSQIGQNRQAIAQKANLSRTPKAGPGTLGRPLAVGKYIPQIHPTARHPRTFTTSRTLRTPPERPSDGFVGIELYIPKRRRQPPSRKKRSISFPATRLVLCRGHLPIPSTPCDIPYPIQHLRASISNADSGPSRSLNELNIISINDFQPEASNDIRTVEDSSPLEAHICRISTDIEVFTQLSQITAPLRDLDSGPEEDHGLDEGRNDAEGEKTNTHSSKIHCENGNEWHSDTDCHRSSNYNLNSILDISSVNQNDDYAYFSNEMRHIKPATKTKTGLNTAECNE